MTKGKKGIGKTYIEDLKNIKKLCIRMYGLGFIIATPKVRAILIESMNDLINDLVNKVEEKRSKK